MPTVMLAGPGGRATVPGMLTLLLTLTACAPDEPAAPPGPELQPAAPGPPQGGPHGGPHGGPGGGQAPSDAAPIAAPPGELSPVGELAAAPKNILLISWDTTRADRLSAYGGRAEAPNLEALAAAGARFDQAVTHFPETALSHWTMLTGVTPPAHGDVPGTGGSQYRGPTLAELTGAHGYATGAFVGGVTLTAQAAGLHRGFDRYDDDYDWYSSDLKRPASEVAGRAADWMKARDGRWFAFVHFFDAHAPYMPPAPWDTRYDPDYQGPMDGSEGALRPYRDEGKRPVPPDDLAHALALYDGELSWLDSWLPTLLDAAGPDTVVILTADHGESFEHDYYFNHRASMWDSTLRVPLVIRAPGVTPGTTVGAQVALTDVAPTALALAGLPTDGKMQGRSLIPLMRGEGGGHEVVYASTDPVMPGFQVAARSIGAKAIWREGLPILGYDLAADPAEATDLGQPGPGLSEALAPWCASLAAAEPLQRAPLDRRHPLPQEIEQLILLGYLERGEGAWRCIE